jgi:hypothetical protein
MPSSRGQIVFTEDTLTKGIREFGPKLNLAVGALMKQSAPQVQNYARRNAPWTDRTGNARQGLFAEYSAGREAFLGSAFGGNGVGQHTITLYHSVNYGIWLEVRFAGRYAIIAPTIEVEGARIMGKMNKLITKLKAVQAI